MKYVIYSVIFLIGFSSGTIFGFIRAPYEFGNYDSQFKASVLAYQNTWLKQGHIDRIIGSNEIELNGELAKYADHLDSNFFWIYKLLGIYEDSSKSAIKNAVNYRLNTPFEEPNLAESAAWKQPADMNDKFAQDVIAGQKRNQQQMQRVIELYREK